MALIGILALCLICFTGGPALAGDYHTGATLFCSDCHVMHYSQSHGYSPSGAGLYTPLGAAGPYTFLLRNDVNDLCLTCHDGSSFAPDVLEANFASNVREAGALNRDGAIPYYPSTGHTLDSADTPPGGSGTWAPDPVEGLTCVNCHNQHGGSSTTVPNPYRNLRTRPGGVSVDPPSYAKGTNDLTKDVFEKFSNDYDAADVNFNEPDQAKSAMGNWCGACHSNFHGGPGSTNVGGTGTPGVDFDRHPTAGVDIGAAGGGHSNKNIFATGDRNGTPTTPKLNWVKVMTNTQNWKPATGAEVTDHTPTCITCHKGHGNKNAFGLIYMNGANAGGITEEGTAGGVYKDLCKQCHVQG
jgi:hypothetical protein